MRPTMIDPGPRRSATLLAAGVALLLPGWTTLARAELPPQYTRWDDLQRIVAQDDIAVRLREPVDRIEVLEDGVFRIQAGRCFLLVTVSRRGQVQDGVPVPGPSVIEDLAIGEPECG